MLDLELQGSESFNVNAVFGDVIKQDIDQPKFLTELKNK